MVLPLPPGLTALIIELLHKLLLSLAASPISLTALLYFIATFMCAMPPQAAAKVCARNASS